MVRWLRITSIHRTTQGVAVFWHGRQVHVRVNQKQHLFIDDSLAPDINFFSQFQIVPHLCMGSLGSVLCDFNFGDLIAPESDTTYARILMLGLGTSYVIVCTFSFADGAGKSTILYQLKHGYGAVQFELSLI